MGRSTQPVDGFVGWIFSANFGFGFREDLPILAHLIYLAYVYHADRVMCLSIIDCFQLLEVKALCMYKRRERWRSQ